MCPIILGATLSSMRGLSGIAGCGSRGASQLSGENSETCTWPMDRAVRLHDNDGLGSGRGNHPCELGVQVASCVFGSSPTIVCRGDTDCLLGCAGGQLFSIHAGPTYWSNPCSWSISCLCRNCLWHGVAGNASPKRAYIQFYSIANASKQYPDVITTQISQDVGEGVIFQWR